MALTLKAVVNKTVRNAIGVIGVENGTGPDNGALFSLPVGALQKISDKLYSNNPALFFSSGIMAKPLGEGTVQITYNKYGSGFAAKSENTVGGTTATAGFITFDKVTIAKELHSWDDPQQKAEKMFAYDISKGTPNVLAERLVRHASEWTNLSIKQGFQTLVAAGLPVATIAAAAGTVQEKGATILHSLISETTKYLQTLKNSGAEFAGYSRSDITIIVDPVVFDDLSLAGLIGDKVTETFAGGQYIVGIIGGYRIVSGDIFLPSEVAVNAAGNAIENGGASKNLKAIIATNDVLVWNVQIVAANVERLAPTNDIGSYIEVARISAITERAKEHKMVKFIVAA